MQAFWNRAYKENITGLSGMVAYNLVLALFPFALLVLFVFGKVVDSPNVEHSVIRTSSGSSPASSRRTLQNAIDRVRDSSTTIGIAAASVDLDRRLVLGGDGHGLLPHLPRRVPGLGGAEAPRRCSCCSAVPPASARQRHGADHRERGPPRAPTTCPSASLTSTLTRTAIAGHRRPGGATFTDHLGDLLGGAEGPHAVAGSVWPGALFFALVHPRRRPTDIFPLYLNNVSDLHRIGGTIGFILIALVWFYAISLALLAGAVINSLRHEQGCHGKPPTRRLTGFRHQVAATRAAAPAQPLRLISWCGLVAFR